MAKFPTYEEIAKNIAEKALNEFQYDGRTIREWIQIIASEECISRRAAYEAVRKIGLCKCNTNEIEAVDECLRAVENLPPVTPQPKMGRWITNSHGFPPEATSVCSECGFDRDFYIRIRGFDKIKYCPNCGAKMQENKE